jgi:hypothetical protein
MAMTVAPRASGTGKPRHLTAGWSPKGCSATAKAVTEELCGFDAPSGTLVVPDRDRSDGAVQHACNTPFEFVLNCSLCLDKITIWQHPVPRITKTVRFDFD